MNKVALKFIDKISKQLPNVQYHALYNAEITSEDAILSNIKEIEGQPVDPEKKYILKTPLIRDVDHKLRLKKAYKKSGKIGVIKYLTPFIIPEKLGQIQALVIRSIP